MAWKIEKWFADVFPGPDKRHIPYVTLPARELVIAASSSLDVALAELISKRLLDLSTEAESFLGADEDGRAPVGSFGGRIQCALLLGLINPSDAAMLRQIKRIRNRFAHRVKIAMTSPDIVSAVLELIALYSKINTPTKKQNIDDVRKLLPTDERAGRAMFIFVAMHLEARLHIQLLMVTRLEPIRFDESKMPAIPERFQKDYEAARGHPKAP